MKEKRVLLAVLCVIFFISSCASQEKPLITKDDTIKIETKLPDPEKDWYLVYDLIKKETFLLNKTEDVGKSCKVSAECTGWCEPSEGSKAGKCSKFPKPIGCKKRLERGEVFDVCANLTIKE